MTAPAPRPCWKVARHGRREAKKAAERQRHQTGEDIVYYRCRWCGSYHLTHRDNMR